MSEKKQVYVAVDKKDKLFYYSDGKYIPVLDEKGEGGDVELKTINGESLKGSGNIEVLTEHQPLKTINGEEIAGKGNIEIQGGDSKPILQLLEGPNSEITDVWNFETGDNIALEYFYNLKEVTSFSAMYQVNADIINGICTFSPENEAMGFEFVADKLTIAGHIYFEAESDEYSMVIEDINDRDSSYVQLGVIKVKEDYQLAHVGGQNISPFLKSVSYVYPGSLMCDGQPPIEGLVGLSFSDDVYVINFLGGNGTSLVAHGNFDIPDVGEEWTIDNIVFPESSVTTLPDITVYAFEENGNYDINLGNLDNLKKIQEQEKTKVNINVINNLKYLESSFVGEATITGSEAIGRLTIYSPFGLICNEQEIEEYKSEEGSSTYGLEVERTLTQALSFPWEKDTDYARILNEVKNTLQAGGFGYNRLEVLHLCSVDGNKIKTQLEAIANLGGHVYGKIFDLAGTDVFYSGDVSVIEDNTTYCGTLYFLLQSGK